MKAEHWIGEEGDDSFFPSSHSPKDKKAILGPGNSRLCCVIESRDWPSAVKKFKIHLKWLEGRS